MSIILNEKEWVEDALYNRQLGPKPTKTLARVARYYHQDQGYSKKEVRNKLDTFLLRCDPDVILIHWDITLDRIAKNANKRPLIKLDGIGVTEAELASISTIDGKQRQRLAFTLLCIAKYWNAVNLSNNGWVNSSDKEIMEMANIRTSIRRQSLMYYDMRALGLIKYSKRIDNLNVRVEYINDSSPEALFISDFRNLGSQYLMYLGESYFQCFACGLTVKKKNNSHKYCSSCAADMYIKQSVDSVMRQRIYSKPPLIT